MVAPKKRCNSPSQLTSLADESGRGSCKQNNDWGRKLQWRETYVLKNNFSFIHLLLLSGE